MPDEQQQVSEVDDFAGEIVDVLALLRRQRREVVFEHVFIHLIDVQVEVLGLERRGRLLVVKSFGKRFAFVPRMPCALGS
jgi:histidinol-phosphate/aromatic aminotransferase/cobyric acid decarboxylase-like protein